jgi:hypothetical protein
MSDRWTRRQWLATTTTAVAGNCLVGPLPGGAVEARPRRLWPLPGASAMVRNCYLPWRRCSISWAALSGW